MAMPLVKATPRASARAKAKTSSVPQRQQQLAARKGGGPIMPGDVLMKQKVRFCRYRFFPTGDLGYGGSRGAEG